MKPTAGYASASDKGIVVALDTKLSQQLIDEGFVRELISKIQNLRKESGFEVMDRILIQYSASKTLQDIVSKYKDTIMQDTLCQDMSLVENVSISILDINGEEFRCSVALK
ncbi:MAG: DUF5915 domain-containing protein, partial [Firmicutes bacterium]|nr:DUF5915 domain-containing protein [Bacillota bacterium]